MFAPAYFGTAYFGSSYFPPGAVNISNQPPTPSSVNYGESVSEQHSVQSSQHKGVGSISVRGKETRGL